MNIFLDNRKFYSKLKSTTWRGRHANRFFQQNNRHKKIKPSRGLSLQAHLNLLADGRLLFRKESMHNPLNDSDVNGNTMAFMADQDLQKDMFLCPECLCEVTEDSFNHKHDVCFRCWFGGI